MNKTGKRILAFIAETDRKIRNRSIKISEWLRNKHVNRQILGKIGYYASLAALLVILGVASNTYRNKAEIPKQKAADEPQAVVSVVTPNPTATPQPTPEPKKYVWPVSGEIINGFADDELIWCNALSQWQTHPAIDIAGKIGESVVACGDGVIKDTYDDPLWGNIIEIDHGEGLVSVYSNLTTINLVEEGQNISCGETISAIGQSAPVEEDMAAHLHFALLKNGEAIDFSVFMAEKGI